MIVMYGGPPLIGPVDPWPEPVTPLPGTPDWGRSRLVPPGTVLPTRPADIPDSAAALRRQLEERAKWLENELRMHEAWRLELATIKAMLAAQPEAADQCSTGPEGK